MQPGQRLHGIRLPSAARLGRIEERALFPARGQARDQAEPDELQALLGGGRGRGVLERRVKGGYDEDAVGLHALRDGGQERRVAAVRGIETAAEDQNAFHFRLLRLETD